MKRMVTFLTYQMQYPHGQYVSSWNRQNCLYQNHLECWLQNAVPKVQTSRRISMGVTQESTVSAGSPSER